MQIQYTQYLINFFDDIFCKRLIFASFEVINYMGTGLLGEKFSGSTKTDPASQALSGSLLL